MPIQINHNNSISEISYEDLIAQIVEESPGPEILIKDSILTDDEWRSLDNLHIFHRYSPTEYPPGDQLIVRRAIESRRELQSIALTSKSHAYIKGNLIEESYYLLPLENLANDNQIRGAARLFYLPSFHPENIFTTVFRTNRIFFEICRGKKSLWGSLPQRMSQKSNSGFWKETCSIFNPSDQNSHARIIRYSELPPPIQSWDEFLEASLLAQDCYRPALDGVGYRHKVYDASTSIDVSWDNPSRDIDTAQFLLMDWYRACLVATGLNGKSIDDQDGA